MTMKGFVHYLQTIVDLNLTVNNVIFQNSSYENIFLRSYISFVYIVWNTAHYT